MKRCRVEVVCLTKEGGDVGNGKDEERAHYNSNIMRIDVKEKCMQLFVEQQGKKRENIAQNNQAEKDRREASA